MLERLIARIRGVASRRSAASELDDELQFHLRQEIEANIARGLGTGEARRVALRDLGGLAQTREAVRDVRTVAFEPIWLDLTHAYRTLRMAPGFTTAAVLTLAVAIGVNSAMFSVFYGILLRPLPYELGDRLALVVREQDMSGAHRPIPAPFSASTEIEGWRTGLNAFESIALSSYINLALRTADGLDIIDGAVVSDTFFSTIRGRMVVGRSIDRRDDTSNVIVISERLSHRLFGTVATALGHPLVLSTRSYVIVGVASRQFQFPTEKTDIWMPAGYVHAANPQCCSFTMVGRLKPGKTVVDAATEAKGLAVSLRALHPGTPASLRANVVSLREKLAEPARSTLVVLFAAAGLVLFAACANVAHLFLTQQFRRTRDRVIRSALGACATRLIRQTLFESMLVSAAGTVIGLLTAQGLVVMLNQWRMVGIPRLDAVRVDGVALLFSAGLMVFTTVAISVAPALQSTSLADALKLGSLGTTPSRGRQRAFGALCVTQLAVSVMLLVGASLLGQSLLRLMHTEFGVTPAHVVTASMNVGGRPTDVEARGRFDRVVESVRTLPGVTDVGLGTGVPPIVSRLRLTLNRPGDVNEYQAQAIAATPGYFRALRLQLLAGRFFTEDDDLDHPPVMIMSVDTARRLFGPGDPIGQTMVLPTMRNGGRGPDDKATLVGVVANVKYSGLDAAADDEVYLPFAQMTWLAPFLVTRTAGDPEPMVQTIRREIARIDPDMVVSEVRTMDDILSTATATPRFRAVILVGISGLALLVASIGLYGVAAQAVSQRIREIGIRMALGAGRGEILQMVLRDGGRLGLIGVLCGVAGSWVGTRLLAGLLYGVSRSDPLSYILACGAVLALSLMATYVPARRAATVDPVVVLRAE